MLYYGEVVKGVSVTSRWDDGLVREQDVAQPAVIGPERAGQEAGEDLQQSWIPGAGWLPGDEVFLAESWELTDGQTALLAYSSLESLVECCGEKQPWAQIPVTELDELLNRTTASVVLWDHALPPEQRQD